MWWVHVGSETHARPWRMGEICLMMQRSTELLIITVWKLDSPIQVLLTTSYSIPGRTIHHK